MGCKWPEHHGGGSEVGVGGGSWWWLVAVLGAVALFASVITAIIHIIAMALTFIGLGAVAAGAVAVPLWFRRRQALRVQYRPQMGQPQWRPGLPPPQQQELAQGGQHLHVHLPPGMHPDELAAILRRAGGR